MDRLAGAACEFVERAHRVQPDRAFGFLAGQQVLVAQAAAGRVRSVPSRALPAATPPTRAGRGWRRNPAPGPAASRPSGHRAPGVPSSADALAPATGPAAPPRTNTAIGRVGQRQAAVAHLTTAVAGELHARGGIGMPDAGCGVRHQQHDGLRQQVQGAPPGSAPGRSNAVARDVPPDARDARSCGAAGRYPP
jgi:hypothetical protein